MDAASLDSPMPQQTAATAEDVTAIWKEHHKLYLDDARERITRTRNILLVVVAGLATFFFGGIQQSVHYVSEVDNRVAKKQTAQSLADRSQHQLENPTVEDGKSGQAKARVTQSQVAQEMEKARVALEKLQAKVDEGVAFKLLGFEFAIPVLLAPTIWMTVLTVLLVYLTRARLNIFRSLGRALRIERVHLRLGPCERIANPEWWLDPLPTWQHLRDDLEMDTACGWRPRPLSPSWISLIALVVLIGGAFLVMGVNFDLLSYTQNAALKDLLKVSPWHSFVAAFFPPTLFAVCMALIVYWRRPSTFPGLLRGETPPPAHLHWQSRRQFMNNLIATSFGGAVFAGSWHFTPSTQPRHSQVRRLGPLPESPLTTYRNANAQAPRIHISTPVRTFTTTYPLSYQPEQIDFVTFRPTSGNNGSRIVLGDVSWALEAMAIDAAQQGIPDALSSACDILLCAAWHDKLFVSRSVRNPSFRLYDLLAGLSFRAKTPHLDKLIKLIKESSMNDQFPDRIQKWTAPDSSWQKRWAPGQTITWKMQTPSPHPQQKVLKLAAV